MEYYCHNPGSQEEFIRTVNYLNKIGASVEPVTFDNIVYLKILCPEGTQETFVGNNTLPDYAVKLPGGGTFYVRKLFHRNKLPNEAYQCVFFNRFINAWLKSSRPSHCIWNAHPFNRK